MMKTALLEPPTRQGGGGGAITVRGSSRGS